MASETLRRIARRVAATRLGAGAMRAVESLVFGGETRERLLGRMLLALEASRFRRRWIWAAGHLPHFSDNRGAWLRAGASASPPDAAALIRGFYVLEMLRPGDALLDIGCGDGFFTRQLYSPRCTLVDAVDIEPTAIATAMRWHPADNIRYHLMDAVEQPFPSGRYQVIAWDGAIGHFPPETTGRMLDKIARALAADGVFCGSESLGREEGHDHLQFFDSLEDLRGLLRPHFRHVQAKEMQYTIGRGQGYLRREGYWRCANSPERLDSAAWSTGGGGQLK